MELMYLRRRGLFNSLTLKTSTSGSFVTDVVAPLKKLLLTLSPIQDLHGYDKPWSGGAGKNKFPNMTEGSYSTTSLSVNVNEYGTAKVTSTEYGTVDVPLNGTVTVQTGQKLVFVGDFTGAVFFLENGTSVDYWRALGNTREITDIATLVGRTIDTVRILVDGAITAKSISIMLVDNSVTDYTYEPYSNICPISGHTQVVTEVCGKNLLDINSTAFKKWGLYSNAFRPLSDDSTIVEISGVADDAVTYVTNSTYCGIGFIVDAKPLERVVSVPQSIGGAVQFWSAYEEGATRLSAGATSCTIPANTSGFVALRTDTRATTTTKIQVELGSIATDYEPYQGTSYTTTLGRTVYGGTLDVVSGELVVDKGFAIFDGSETWTKNTRALNAFYVARPQGCKQATTMVSDKFVYVDNVQMLYNTYGTCYTGSSMNFSVNPATIGGDTIEDWKAWLANNPLQVVYELATPQTYQLTPQQINSLKGQNNFIAEDGAEIAEITYWSH